VEFIDPKLVTFAVSLINFFFTQHKDVTIYAFSFSPLSKESADQDQNTFLCFKKMWPKLYDDALSGKA